MNARFRTRAIQESARICLGTGLVHVQKGTTTVEQNAAKEMLEIDLIKDFFFSILH